MTTHEPTYLEYTYAYHLAKLMADKEAMAVLSVEIGTRREQLRQAVNDPLGYGWQGRIAISGDAERQINFYEGFVAFCIVRKEPVPTEARVAFLLTHGYYTAAELNAYPEFSKNYFEKLMSEESKEFMEADFQKDVLEAVSSALDQKDEFFKGDEKAIRSLEDMSKKWEANQGTFSLQEKNQMLCAMLAILQDKL